MERPFCGCHSCEEKKNEKSSKKKVTGISPERQEMAVVEAPTVSTCGALDRSFTGPWRPPPRPGRDPSISEVYSPKKILSQSVGNDRRPAPYSRSRSITWLAPFKAVSTTTTRQSISTGQGRMMTKNSQEGPKRDGTKHHVRTPRMALTRAWALEMTKDRVWLKTVSTQHGK